MRLILSLLLATPLAAAASPTLTIQGSCPGAVSVTLTGATAGGRVGLVLGDGVAFNTIPSGVCAGAELDLHAPSLLRVLTADPAGEVHLSGQPAAQQCGALVQAIDLATCAASPVRAVTPGGNVPPLVRSADVTPTVAYTDSTLTCATAGAIDYDGDPVTFGYTWQVNGVVAGSAATLGGASFSRGDSVACTATPTDGQASGPAVTSGPRVIANTPPSLGVITLTPSNPTVSSTLSAQVSPTDADGDAVSLQRDWYVNGQLALADALTFPVGAWAAKGDSVDVTVTASDGVDTAGATSAPVVVQNTPPTITTVTITPSAPTTASTLSCAYAGYADADGDADASTIAWSVGGVTVGAGPTLSGAAYGGQTVTCTVTPHDGESAGATRSAQVTVAAPRGPLSTRPVGWQTTCSAYGSSVQLTSGTVAFYYKFQLTAPKTLDGVVFETAIGSQVTASVHAAVYTDASGPGVKLVQGSGSFVVGGPVTSHEIPVAATALAAGTYWIGIAANGGTFIPTCNTLGTEPFYYSLESVGTTFTFRDPPTLVGPFDSSANRWGVVYVHPMGF